ncbi:hypothetical protein L1787_04140 [Acuticoccus sp. M5D2P5]|uniref:hypothetical protein n=1 Tax=Acuticoccus kalidii TaxID=2910977 RepID=UPI001F1D9157|nr:hypothetical protein [Acuticoccus kalidii]MCF3932606.1 hypothetical protein [Acuticoccus kalidii]
MSLCVIVANMTPAHFGWGVRAPSLRAEQLAHLARAVYDEVRFLIFLSRFNLLRQERGFAVLASSREDTTVIPASAFTTYAERLAPATFVFTQAEFAEEAAFAAARHTVVYDILAPRAKELAAGGAADAALQTHHDQHRRMIACARRVLVNGARSERLFADDLQGADTALCPLAPEPPTMARTAGDTLIFGGKPQRWTQSAPLFEAMAAYLTARRDVPAIMIAEPPKPNEAHAAAYSELFLAPNVTPLWNISHHNYQELLSRAAGYIDWAPLSDERTYATSTRILQAIAARVPVLHQAGTALDEFFDVFPGMCIEGPIEPRHVAAFAERAIAGGYDREVEAAAGRLAAFRTAPVFEGLAA